jgi:UDP-sugar transporter A1/2/3
LSSHSHPQAFQSNAQYFASANLSVPTFQLAYQLKIPATAVFSILLLKRSLNLTQWISLFSLTLGVGIVQLHSLTPSKSAATALAHPVQNHTLGLIAVIAACLSSGFATTYFERLLKLSTPGDAPPPSVWIRNIQLSLFGICIGLPVVWYEVGGGWGVLDRIGTGRGDVFQGFNGLTLVVILLQSTGGLLAGMSNPTTLLTATDEVNTALVMQYADNILKCFSTSLSILLSFVASIYLFSFQVSRSRVDREKQD